MKDGNETDTDCGGGTCPACADLKACLVDSDCKSDNCIGNVCKESTCFDSKQNGTETAIDCGGGTCPPCANGKTCKVGSDCTTGNCANGVCAGVPNWWGTGADGDVSLFADLLLPSTTDGDVVVANYHNLTIGAGTTLTTSTRTKGLIVYVQGDATINGTLSMTARGANVDPVQAGVPATGIRFVRKRPGGIDTLAGSDLSGCGTLAITAEGHQPGVSGDGSIYTIARAGAGGGDGSCGVVSPNGQSGAKQSGGGGAGACDTSDPGPGNGGNGAAGTCFSGGPGGGSYWVQHCPNACERLPGTPGNANGGPGGAAGCGPSGISGGGGTGNPGGTSCNSTGGLNGTGGLLVLLVGGNLTVGPQGSVSANGVDSIGGGGASGGGNVLVLYAGKLTIDATNTTPFQALGGHFSGYTSGNGGNGSIQVFQVSP